MINYPNTTPWSDFNNWNISSTPITDTETTIKNNIYNEIDRVSELLEAYDFPVEDEIELQNYRSKLIKDLTK